MSWLPEGTELGELALEETFVFYDGPRVFSCRSLTDQLFLAAWAEEGAVADTWLYVPISAARIAMVRSGGLLLRAAFAAPEGLVYNVTIPHDADRSCEVITAAPADLSDEWLPGENFKLDIPTRTLRPAEKEQEVERRARQEGRTHLRLRVQLPAYTRSEAPTRKIGELLILTQTIYDNIGLSLLEDDPPQRGRIPDKVTYETASELVGFAAASFVVEIAASRSNDLFGDSAFADVTKELLKLLGLGLERELLLDELSTLRPRGAKSFRSFVTGLASTGGDVMVSAAGENLPFTRQVLTAERLESMVLILNNLVPDEVSEIRGRMRLYAADLTRKIFGAHDEFNDLRYEGKIADRALPQVDHAQINDLYDVVVSVFPVFDEAVGERKPRYVLEQLVVADLEEAPVPPMEIKADPTVKDS
ncbi:MAG: DUF6575 domain-containing protein [Pseudonocardiaceae bacterium]